MEAVSDILNTRTREPDGLTRMVVVSLAAHAVLVSVILLSPSLEPQADTERDVMTISLGGAPGPRSGGMTPMGGRPVQAPAPAEPVRRPAPAPPAARTPEMTMPSERAPRAPRTPVKEAPREATGRTPTQGAQPAFGSAVAETGARGAGFGLTTGGGGTGGYLDVGNFCCPEYLNTMLQLIQRNWNSRQQVAGQTTVTFTIERDGRLTNVLVEKPSGYFALDQTAQRAILQTRQLPPLPSQYTENNLTVHLVFTYER